MDAQYQFDQLPALIRDRFHNDPQEMLAFLNDPNNYDEAIKLGLVNPPPAPEIDVDAPVSPPAGGDPQRPQTAGGGSSPASP
jgi:phage internal scaffolding protein